MKPSAPHFSYLLPRDPTFNLEKPGDKPSYLDVDKVIPSRWRVGVRPVLKAWPLGSLAPSPPARKELRPTRREGRGHKLGVEETGVNRIFKAGHSPTPLASASPLPPLPAASAPPTPKQSPGQGLKANVEQRRQELSDK